MSPVRAFSFSMMLLLVFATSACTTIGTNPNSAPNVEDEETWDPFEPFNRTMFTFNEKFDDWLLKPVAKGYDLIFPRPVKRSIGNFFSNLIQPRVAVNDLLQGKGKQAARDTGRFLINSTVGVLGLFDVARHLDLEAREEDWGQTFAVWGINGGPYFVWPIIGPRYLRDTVGFGFDWLSNPVTYIDDPYTSWGLWSVDIVDTRARFLPADKVIKQAAGDDKYVFIREAYRQRRRNLIYDGNPPKPVFIDDEAEGPAPKPAAAPAQ